MVDVEPALFFSFPNLKSEFGVKMYHSFLIRGSISIVHINGDASCFLGQWFLVMKSWLIKHSVAPELKRAQELTIFPNKP